MKLFIPLALLLLPACASAPLASTYNVEIDNTFSADQTEQIMAALDQWHAKTGATFAPVIKAVSPAQGDSGTIYIHHAMAWEATSVDASAVAYTKTLPGALSPSNLTGGIGGIDGGTVLMPDLEGWKFHTCVLHELGHAMGLHHDYAGTVMCRSAGCSAHDITESDVIQWRSYR